MQEADVMKKACHKHLAELLSGLPAIFGSLNLAFAATCIKIKICLFAGVFQRVCLLANATLR